MMRRVRGKLMDRAGVLLTAAALATTGTVVFGTTAAHAVAFTYDYQSLGNKRWAIDAKDGFGHIVGEVMWNGDPYGNAPGDALSAYDPEKDGYGVVAHLSTGRTASTLGHPSPYSTGWVTGNLPEGHHYDMWLQIGKSGLYTYSKKIQVTS